MCDGDSSPEYSYNDDFSYNQDNISNIYIHKSRPISVKSKQFQHSKYKYLKDLITLVKKEHCIYDRSLPIKQRTKDFRDRSWASISSKLKRSVKTCRYDWTVLRMGLSKTLRRSRDRGIKGLPDDKKDWIFYDDMTFLLPHVRFYDKSRGLLEYHGDEVMLTSKQYTSTSKTEANTGEHIETIEINDDSDDDALLMSQSEDTEEVNNAIQQINNVSTLCYVNERIDNVDNTAEVNVNSVQDLSEKCEGVNLKIVKIESVASDFIGTVKMENKTSAIEGSYEGHCYETIKIEKIKTEEDNCERNNIDDVKQDNGIFKSENIESNVSGDNLETNIFNDKNDEINVLDIKIETVECKFEHGGALETDFKKEFPDNGLSNVTIEKVECADTSNALNETDSEIKDIILNISAEEDQSENIENDIAYVENEHSGVFETSNTERTEIKNETQHKTIEIDKYTPNINCVIQTNENNSELITIDDDEDEPFHDSIEDEDFDTKLTALVKKYPIMYATDARSAITRKERLFTWEKIARRLKKSVSQCKERWCYLERRYALVIKNPLRVHSRKTTAYIERFHKKRKWFTTHMDFMEPYVLARRKAVGLNNIQIILDGGRKRPRIIKKSSKNDSVETNVNDDDSGSDTEADDGLKTLISSVFKDCENRNSINTTEETDDDDLSFYTNFFS